MAVSAQKPPSRRHLARVLSEAVPVVNNHASRLEELKAACEALDHRLQLTETQLALVPTWRQRLSWAIRGRLG